MTSCGLLKDGDSKERKEAKQGDGNNQGTGEQAKPAPVRVVGEIASVHRAEGFVLIKRYFQTAGGFGKGILISTLSLNGETSSLVLTGEKLGRYYAADIQEGNPSKGDAVIVRDLPKGEVAPSLALPEAPKEGESAPWLRNSPVPGL